MKQLELNMWTWRLRMTTMIWKLLSDSREKSMSIERGLVNDMREVVVPDRGK
jgi:hypothetical protein